MKWRVVEYVNRKDSCGFHVEKRILFFFWKDVTSRDTLESAFKYIEREKGWNAKRIHYSRDYMVNEMAKVKEGDK